MTFDPTIIASYAIADVQPGTWDDTDPESAGGYIADEGDGVPMGLAFVQFSAGAEFDFVWPYDEVSIVTRGSVSIRSGGELLTAREGEVLTQPRGVPGRFEIAEDMEMICVHYPTFARAFGMRVHEHHTIAEGGGNLPEPDVPAHQQRRRLNLHRRPESTALTTISNSQLASRIKTLVMPRELRF